MTTTYLFSGKLSMNNYTPDSGLISFYVETEDDEFWCHADAGPVFRSFSVSDLNPGNTITGSRTDDYRLLSMQIGELQCD